MLAFIFGEELNISATRAQIEALQLSEPRLDIGRPLEDKYTSFPHGCLHAFLRAASQGNAIIEKSIKLAHTEMDVLVDEEDASYKDAISTKDLYMRKLVRVSVARMYSSEPGEALQIRSVVDHIVSRERMLAEKQDRQSNFEGQQLFDEVNGTTILSTSHSLLT
jgi:hypothetical protein